MDLGHDQQVEMEGFLKRSMHRGFTSEIHKGRGFGRRWVKGEPGLVAAHRCLSRDFIAFLLRPYPLCAHNELKAHDQAFGSPGPMGGHVTKLARGPLLPVVKWPSQL